MIAESGGPIRRQVASRWLRDKPLPELLEIVAKQRPKDVLAQQEKVAAADGLAFIAPIFWMNFPAILRGWIERVFTYGFVYTMTRDAWLQGDLSGRQPLLKHRKALIMTPTFFRESDYRDSGCGAAIERLVDDFGFRYPGIEQVEHVYFYAVGAVDDATRRGATCSRLTGSGRSSSRLRPARRGSRAGDDRRRCEMSGYCSSAPLYSASRSGPPGRARLRRLRLRVDDRADARERATEMDVPQHQRDPGQHRGDPRVARD